jgi:hypothetical protein
VPDSRDSASEHVWSHDDRPSYVAAPTEAIEVAEPDHGSTNWGVWVVCDRAGMLSPLVTDVPNRSTALERMAVSPPPVSTCPPVTTEMRT